MWPVMTGSVLAVLIGSLALVAGLLLMLLPLVASELARPRDSFWAAVVLLLGLVLVTASDRLTGAPMLGDAGAWEARMEKGMEALVASVRNGLNAMPPGGLCNSCSDEDYAALITYMATAQ